MNPFSRLYPAVRGVLGFVIVVGWLVAPVYDAAARCGRRVGCRSSLTKWPLILAVLAVLTTGWTAIAVSGWQTFTTADGLGDNNVIALLEDHSGNLWVGAFGGVSRYDGQTWRTFTAAEGPRDLIVVPLLEDQSGAIWIGTSGGGVSRYDGQRTWRTFTTADGLGSGQITALLEDHSGGIWVGTSDGGVSWYDGRSWRTFTTADGLVSNFVTSLVEDHEGNLWFGTQYDGVHDGGLSRYDGRTWSTFTFTFTFGNTGVKSILEDSAGNLWVGTFYGGVSRYDGQTWRHFTTADGLASNDVTTLLEDRSGNLWVGTQRGLSHYDKQAWRSFTTTDGLGGNYISCLLEDRSGNLWAGNDGGASRFDGRAWRTFTTADGLPGVLVQTILEDGSGNLWFGTVDFFNATACGLSRYDGQGWKTFTASDGLGAGAKRKVLEDHSGNLWVGTRGGGVSRYDGRSWRTFTTVDGLGSNYVGSLLEDRLGNLWAGTQAGVSRYDGHSWRTFTTTDGLAGNYVSCLLEDRLGNLWVGTQGGLSHYDGQSWTLMNPPNGLAGPVVATILEDRHGVIWVATDFASDSNGNSFGGVVSQYDGTTWHTFDEPRRSMFLAVLEDRVGNLWFGGDGWGVSRYDGQTWRTFTTAEGLADNYVEAIREDRSGNLWFGTKGGVSRFDGQIWSTFTTADGLGSNEVASMLEDRSGSLWFGALGGGVNRYDGTDWRQYTKLEGLAANNAYPLLEDHGGSIWFGTDAGITRYDPDRVPPRTLFNSRPPAVAAATTLTAGFVAAFGEALVQFSSRLDSLSWSPWSPVGSWTGANLADGHHALQARARDREGNVEYTPAVASFEVDATPPSPNLQAPAFGQPVRGTVAVRGTAADGRFKSYEVEARPAGVPSWNPPDATVLTQSSAPVSGGLLATWNTSGLPDGNYELRLSVVDSLGLTGSVQVAVVVDNHFPFAEETSPARVPAATGGDLYTTNQELHLYFPPHAFDQDALVSIAAAGSPLDTLPAGAIQVLPAYDIAWAASLRKPATLELSTSGKAPVPGALAVYSSSDGTSWQRLGGTPEEGKVSLAVQQAGRYALFAETATPTGDASLSALSFTPRVFSPTGSFANDHVAIGFSLGRSAPVTVRIYNRAGRLVNEVVSGQTMGPGAGIVRWDGRDRGGVYVADGIYLVTVEAVGQTRKSTLAVVR